jgi:hypothetical protein
MDCRPAPWERDPNKAEALQVITLAKLGWFRKYAETQGAEVFKFGLEGKLKFPCVNMEDVEKW